MHRCDWKGRIACSHASEIRYSWASLVWKGRSYTEGEGVACIGRILRAQIPSVAPFARKAKALIGD
jgi:hypothetical protein